MDRLAQEMKVMFDKDELDEFFSAFQALEAPLTGGFEEVCDGPQDPHNVAYC